MPSATPAHGCMLKRICGAAAGTRGMRRLVAVPATASAAMTTPTSHSWFLQIANR